MKAKESSNTQMSLFEIIPGIKDESSLETEDMISVSKVKFIEQENVTYEELFRGFNEIRVITYSYALGFIERIMKLFDRGEVIIGFDQLVNQDTASLMANQEFSINEICRHRYLQERIINDEFRFYVLNDLISHQKVYLLKADNGRFRTIIGSANLSGRAWTGEQIESIFVCDDYECYIEYEKKYETLRQFSTDAISKTAVPILEDGTNVNELPIFKQLENEHTILIHDIQTDEEKEYAFHIQKLNAEWKERLKKIKMKPSKNGNVTLELKEIQKMFTGIKKDNEIKKKRLRINPQFVLDFENHTAAFNQKPFVLTPNTSEIQNDLKNLYEYMDGFDIFTKDTIRLKTLYWKVLNYVFLSPFIAKLRYEGNRYGYEDRFFPMYMLIYGESDAGKTKFISLVRKLMFNEMLPPLKQDNLSSKPMAALKEDVKGCPILIDEITTTYWRYVKDIVKMDTFLIEKKMINHPSFIFLSNDIKQLAPELSKRIVAINIDNRLNKTTAAYNAKRTNTLVKNVGNSLYREYLRRMFEGFDKLLDAMSEHDGDDKSKLWIPDIFELSSTILLDIMEQFSDHTPAEFRIFTWFDYMGDGVIAEKATEMIREEFSHNAGIFSVNETKNELEIDFSCYDNNESRKKQDVLKAELPADMECTIVGTKIILKLDVIQKHTGLSFKTKKGFLWFRR